jgi:hypothetical protein
VSVGTEDATEHLVALRKVLGRVRDSGMKLKLPKCQFGKRSVEVLGHQVTPLGILPSEGHLSAVKTLQEPSNARELMRFLGLAKYFKELLEDFSHRTKRLYDVLRGTNVDKKKSKRVSVFVPDFEKKWTKLQRDAWQYIKDDLSSPTILTSPDRYADKMVMTDASGYGIGAVLLQRNSKTDSWRPVAFASRKLKGAETRYTVTEQECLAVMFAMRKWRHW